MKIQTTEAVRRFNAQVELADIALEREGSPRDSETDPRKLLPTLRATGHHDLAASLAESAAVLGYFRPDGAGQPAEPAQAPAINPTKSVQPHEDWCMCHSCCESDEDQERDHLRNVVERLLNAYAWGRKSTKPENLHAAVRSAMEAIGEL